jgi:hypothetical protein
MKNHELSSANPNQEQPAESHETNSEMSFGEALDALVNYASNPDDLRDNSLLMDNIADARSGEPNALENVLAIVRAEQDNLGGG